MPGDVAVPGANLQLGGHHGSDAGGGPQVWDRRQLLARHHDGGRQGHALPDGDRAEQHAGPAAGGEHPAGRDPEGAERIPREETPLLPPVSSHHTPLTRPLTAFTIGHSKLNIFTDASGRFFRRIKIKSFQLVPITSFSETQFHLVR